jgi:membrane protein DedA with SNARE-associated domain
MPLVPFLLYTALGTLIWTGGALAYSGRILGRQFPQVGQYLGRISWLVVAGAAVVYVARVARLMRSE